MIVSLNKVKFIAMLGLLVINIFCSNSATINQIVNKDNSKPSSVSTVNRKTIAKDLKYILK